MKTQERWSARRKTRSFTIKSFSDAKRILYYARIIYARKSSLIPADMRGPQVYEVEKAMNILRPSSKMALPYSNESAGCFFEIIRGRLAPPLLFCISMHRGFHVCCKIQLTLFSFRLNLFLSSYNFYNCSLLHGTQ